MSHTQSIILNFNRDFVNSKPFDYTQAANKILDLMPRSSVALYSATLQRKPIVLLKDATIQLAADENLLLPSADQLNVDLSDKVSAAFRTDAQARIARLSALTYNDEQGGFLAKRTIPKGEYTRGEFIDIVRNAFQTAINIDNDKARSVSSDNYLLPYDYRGAPEENRVFMGLVNNFTNYYSQWTTANTSVDMEIGVSGKSADADDPTFNLWFADTSAVADYAQAYHLADVPVNILAKSQFTDGPLYENEASHVQYNINYSAADTAYDRKIYFGFYSDHAMSYANSIGGPDTLNEINVLPNYYNGESTGLCPESWFGVQHIQSNSSGQCYIDMFANGKLMENGYDTTGRAAGLDSTNDYKLGESMILIQRTPVESNNNLGICGFRFYYVDQKFNGAHEQSAAFETRRYYWQYYTNRTLNAAGNRGYQEEVFFDSRTHDWYIPEALAEAGFLAEGLEAWNDATYKEATGGLCPLIAFNNVIQGDSQDGEGDNVYNVKYPPTYLKPQTRGSPTLNNKRVPMLGIKAYGYDNNHTSQEIKEIIGSGSSNYKAANWMLYANQGLQSNTSVYFPANYPMDINSQAGILKLYGDNTEYNIELPSLPLRTFNTTAKSNCVSGNERPIVFNTGALLSGDMSGVDETFITKEIIPYTEKYLSLENRDPININAMNVQIRHAEDNSLAEEITDAKVEIIIKN